MRAPAAWLWVGLIGLPPCLTYADDPTPTRTEAPVSDNDGDILLTLQQRALPDLIRSLTPQKPSKGLRLIRVIGGIHDARATEYLIQGYRKAPTDGIRCKLLESMGKLRDPTLFEFFSERVDDPHVPIQCYAIWALGELGTPKAIDVLRPKLDNSNIYVQMTTIDALGKTGANPDVAYALIVFLHDPDVQLRYLAAKALKGVAAPGNVEELFSALLNEESLDVQDALAATLGAIGGSEAVKRFSELLKSSVSPDKEHWAETGLACAEPALVIEALKPMLDGSNLTLKISALRVLEKLDPESAKGQEAWIAPVRVWARSADSDLRQAARLFLEKLKDAEDREAGSHD